MRSTRTSFNLRPVNVPTALYDSVTTYFTTPDFKVGVSKTQVVGNNLLFSGEAIPQGGGQYQTDYGSLATSRGSFFVIEYGTIRVSLPQTDADQNGVADWLELHNAANISGTGVVTAEWPTPANLGFAVTLVRAARQTTGTFTLVYTTGRVVTGQWIALSAEGTLQYTRTPVPSYSLLQDGFTTAAGTFTVINENSVYFPPTFVRSPDLTQLQFTGATVTRQGSRYIGTASYSDGLPQTDWADYTQTVLTLIDTNDSDNDGIPNLSDSLRVALPLRVQSITLPTKQNFRLTFQAPAGQDCQVQYSTNFRDWQTFHRVTGRGILETLDWPRSTTSTYFRLYTP